MTGDTTQCQWYGGVPPPFHVLSIYDSFLLFHPWLFLRITRTILSIRSPRCFVRALCGSDTAAGRYPPNSSINLHLVHWAPCRAATVLALVISPYSLQAIFLFPAHLPFVFIKTNCAYAHEHCTTDLCKRQYSSSFTCMQKGVVSHHSLSIIFYTSSCFTTSTIR